MFLKAPAKLWDLAKMKRKLSKTGVSEGHVFEWILLVCKSLVLSRTMRDAPLAIRTRENTTPYLGKEFGLIEVIVWLTWRRSPLFDFSMLLNFFILGHSVRRQP